MEKISKFEEITGFKFNWRQIKIGLLAFLVMFVISLFALKPHLGAAIYHNFADIDDYKIFSNHEVMAGNAVAWQKGAEHAAPPESTQRLLNELDTTALLMVENGKIVYEKYSLDGGENELSGSFSMAKSIVALLAGFAYQEGAIKNLNTPIDTWITEWADRPEGKIKVVDLLTMSSGLNWEESYWNPFSITTEAYYGSTLIRTALKQRLIAEPGTRYSYQSGTTQLLGMVVSRAVNESLADYASSRLWKPIGAERTALWSTDHPDVLPNSSALGLNPTVEKAYCCFNARARDFAKLGQFVLQRGKWNGKQLLDQKYLSEMTTGKTVPWYGYQTWVLNTPQGSVPYFRGILGQYVIMIPQKNRVIVRLGKKMGERDDHHPVEVRELVEWALK